MVEAVGHGEEVRHVAGSVVVYLGFDVMPVLRRGQQRGRNVFAASEYDAVHVAEHLGSVRLVIAPQTYQHAAVAPQVTDAIGIEVGCCHGVSAIAEIAGFHLRQHRQRDACFAKSLHNIRTELIVSIGPPGNGDAHFFLVAV